MSYAPSFAIINAEELQRLNKEGASASVMSVYLTLCAYAQQKETCFPSLGTIQEWIKGSITQSTISKALRWLRERKFIEQERRTSKERFRLTYRKMVKATSSLVQRAREKIKERVQMDNRGERVQMDNRSKNHRRKPFFRQKWKKKEFLGYGRFESGVKPDDNGEVSSAERVFQRFTIEHPTYDVKMLSDADLSVIVNALTSNIPADVSWRETLGSVPKNQSFFEELLAL